MITHIYTNIVVYIRLQLKIAPRIVENGQDEQLANQKFEQDLQIYYKYLFPHELLFEWLSYPSDNQKLRSSLQYMERREFSFEANMIDIPVYMRYQSFSRPELFQKALVESNPIVRKYDIGAVFEKVPKKLSKLEAIEKEFVIDIDMTDYDDVRTCCQGAKICPKCWKFIKVACQVLYKSLTDDFNFKHILWIYSGRRGIHLWVCDESARKMGNQMRKNIVSYLHINIGNETSGEMVKKMNKKNDKLPYHPSISRAVNLVNRQFEEIIIKDQNSLVKEKVVTKIQNLLKQNAVSVQLPQNKDSGQLFMFLNDALEKVDKIRLLDQIKMMCLYPRLDANVSTTINHLLKGPFSIHPSTQNVCVPFTYKQFKEFDPFSVPNLKTLIPELKSVNIPERNNDTLYPCLAEQTSMAKYVQIFKEFIENYKRTNDKGIQNLIV